MAEDQRQDEVVVEEQPHEPVDARLGIDQQYQLMRMLERIPVPRPLCLTGNVGQPWRE